MSSPSPIVRLSLPLMTAVIAGLTLLALVLVVEIHGGIWRYAFFAIPAIVAVYHLNEYPEAPVRAVPVLPAAPRAGRRFLPHSHRFRDREPGGGFRGPRRGGRPHRREGRDPRSGGGLRSGRVVAARSRRLDVPVTSVRRRASARAPVRSPPERRAGREPRPRPGS